MGKKKKTEVLEYEEEVAWENTPEVKFVIEFCEQLLAKLTAQLLEEPDELAKLFQKLVRDLSRKYKMMLDKSSINKIYQELVKRKLVAPSFIIDSVTKNKSVRSRSGVLPVSIATDGNTFSCAYDCYFCPDESVKNGAPRNISRSYLSSEGTFIRGAVENFEAAGQIWRRLMELEFMGHPPDKIEIIVLGGTWDSYPAEYREEFILQTFYACNMFHRISLRLAGDLSHLTREWADQNPFQQGLGFDKERNIIRHLRPPKSLAEEKAENQESPCGRIIGVLLETRPDQISKSSLVKKRSLGCTRIQLGLQHTDNEILKLNNRGHTVEKSISAIKFARDACYKIDGHLMPDLPGTTPEKDIEMISKIFLGEDLQLDYCKLYPCLDLPYTVTRKWKEEGKWKPLAEHDFPVFLDILRFAMANVPPWVRVNRVQRDFPEATEKNQYLGFVSENIKSNLQQYVYNELAKHGQACYDIRSREIKNQFPNDYSTRAKLFIRSYRASEGTEFFISVELPQRKAKSPDDAILMGLLRLRLTDYDTLRIRSCDAPKAASHLMKEFVEEPMALIRELHVYGNLQMAAPTDAERANSQHTGVGKFLMAVAERLAMGFGFHKLCVISGVGVRGYYEKLGYTLNTGPGEFLMKEIAAVGSNLLPLTLFGGDYTDDDILIPVSTLTTVTKHLQQVDYSHLSRRKRPFLASIRANTPWYARHTYHHIQSGNAQLLIIDLPQQAAAAAAAVRNDRLVAVLTVAILGLAILLPIFFPQYRYTSN